MSAGQALHAALALARTPQLAGAMRAQPLPPGVIVLLRIVAGEGDALDDASRAVGRPRREIAEAAALYIQKVMLHASAPAERVLGVAPGADRSEARAHMRLLMLWLHPDKSSTDWRAAFAGRVLASWRAFSAGDSAAEPSGALVAPSPRAKTRSARSPGRRRRHGLRLPWVAVPIERARRPWRRRAALALAAVAILAIAFAPGGPPARFIASLFDDDDATPAAPATAAAPGATAYGSLPDTVVLPASTRTMGAEPQP